MSDYLKTSRFLKKRRYSDARSCLGEKIGLFNKRFWWHAVGKARDNFETVEHEIKDHLDKAVSGKYASSVHFYLFMIGRCEDSARPTIMFFCLEVGPRTLAKTTIDNSTLKARLSGYKTGHAATQPQIGQLCQPGADQDQEHGRTTDAAHMDVYFDPSDPINSRGIPIFFRHSNGMVRRAIAITVFDKGECALLSVSHIFFDSTSGTHSDWRGDDQYDFGSDTESEGDNEESVAATSRASNSSLEETSCDRSDSRSSQNDVSDAMEGRSPEVLDQPVLDQPSALTNQNANSRPGKEPKNEPSIFMPDLPPFQSLKLLGTMTRHSVDQDWALITIDDVDLQSRLHKHTVIDRFPPRDVPRSMKGHVTVFTTHGSLPGNLSEHTTYTRLPNSATFQAIFHVSLSSPIHWGDCGAGVWGDAPDGMLYGHVVASSETGQVLYIIASHQIFESTGVEWGPPTFAVEAERFRVDVAQSESKDDELTALTGLTLVSEDSVPRMVINNPDKIPLPLQWKQTDLPQSLHKSIQPGTIGAPTTSQLVSYTVALPNDQPGKIETPPKTHSSFPSFSKYKDRKLARKLRPPIRKTLADQILSLFVKSTFDEKPQDYLPERSLEKLLTQSAIEEELKNGDLDQDLDDADIQNITGWVLQYAIKVFAITLQCDGSPSFLLQAMEHFYVCNFTDEDLPIEDPRPSGMPAPLTPEAFEPWSEWKHDKFFKEQWTCLVPVFGPPPKYDYNLSSQCIMPFAKQNAGAKGGAFSSVYRVQVHKDHQKHIGMQDVAIKQIIVGNSADQSETDKAWEIEARALESINRLDHDSIVKSVAAIRRGNSRYFMFPWADGDSLRDFWNKTPRQVPNPKTVFEIVQQLRNLADALDHLHNFDGGQPIHSTIEESVAPAEESIAIPKVRLQDEDDNEVNDYRDTVKKGSIRHGDLKPENILRFMKPHTTLGNLKIADMGLAKRHVLATQERVQRTSMTYGTRRYEAPETVTAVNGRSRLYDIWSIGCIAFEFIIWTLYGNEQLANFYSQATEEAQGEWTYYEIATGGELREAQVNKAVMRWANHLRLHDPEIQAVAGSALGDLLNVVLEKLLVVSLPPNRESSLESGGGGRPFQPPAFLESKTRYRATAAEFRDMLDGILAKADQPNYLYTGKSRTKISMPKSQVGFLFATAPRRAEGSKVPAVIARPSGTLVSGILGRPIGADYTLPPLEDWTFHVDNIFAEKLLAHVGTESFSVQPKTSAKLCLRCSSLDFWKAGFALEDTVSELQERAKSCDLCRILRNVYDDSPGVKGEKVRFERNQSVITVTGNRFPVLSIFRSPQLDPPFAIQLGFPELPKPASDAFFSIIGLWLDDCNENHHGCLGSAHHTLPTRLMDVGTIEQPHLRLIEPRETTSGSMEYLALSHPWGDTTTYSPFSTLKENIERFKTSIPYHELPATFKDAVDCTRNLGVRYLWIDSICIIQGADGDFAEEAGKMEDVFSGAYCVIAASRAKDQRAGFLGPRPQGDYVTFDSDTNKPFYICKTIDNFNKDVIEGTLNRRGWVLQERALARRTIYFTENQTYFECGHGVRCETLTRMQNNMADFLGDPQFPAKAMRTNSRALKIAYFQGLYKQYSRLNFTRSYDRPFAISGLEKRLQKAFDSSGRYGVFDDNDRANPGLFHRSLLWQRDRDNGEDTCLKIIDFPVDREIQIPSWSWMAYEGAIDYCDPPMKTADWETETVLSPWNDRHKAESESSTSDMALTVTARDFTVRGRLPNEVKLTYDTDITTGPAGQRAQCVIVARSREGRSDNDKTYYVLIVASTGGYTAHGEQSYKRIGAGFMLGKYITLDTPGVVVKVF